jgi:hypothetical protein
MIETKATCKHGVLTERDTCGKCGLPFDDWPRELRPAPVLTGACVHDYDIMNDNCRKCGMYGADIEKEYRLRHPVRTAVKRLARADLHREVFHGIRQYPAGFLFTGLIGFNVGIAFGVIVGLLVSG